MYCLIMPCVHQDLSNSEICDQLLIKDLPLDEQGVRNKSETDYNR